MDLVSGGLIFRYLNCFCFLGICWNWVLFKDETLHSQSVSVCEWWLYVVLFAIIFQDLDAFYKGFFYHCGILFLGLLDHGLAWLVKLGSGDIRMLLGLESG